MTSFNAKLSPSNNGCSVSNLISVRWSMLNRLLISCFIVLGICSLAISARKPNLPVFTPIIGIPVSLINVVASRIVPSPPMLMNKSMFFYIRMRKLKKGHVACMLHVCCMYVACMLHVCCMCIALCPPPSTGRP